MKKTSKEFWSIRWIETEGPTIRRMEQTVSAQKVYQVAGELEGRGYITWLSPVEPVAEVRS